MFGSFPLVQVSELAFFPEQDRKEFFLICRFDCFSADSQLVYLLMLAARSFFCSNKVDETLRYLSVHDNNNIRYFGGHTKRVVTLCMSPVDDTFLSRVVNKTIKEGWR